MAGHEELKEAAPGHEEVEQAYVKITDFLVLAQRNGGLVPPFGGTNLLSRGINKEQHRKSPDQRF